MCNKPITLVINIRAMLIIINTSLIEFSFPFLKENNGNFENWSLLIIKKDRKMIIGKIKKLISDTVANQDIVIC